MKLSVASPLSTSAAVTTTTEPAWIELESSSPWVVIVVVVVGKVVVGKGMLRLCFLFGSSDHSCNTNVGARWGTAT